MVLRFSIVLLAEARQKEPATNERQPTKEGGHSCPPANDSRKKRAFARHFLLSLAHDKSVVAP